MCRNRSGLGLLGRLALHAIDAFALINVERLYEAVDAVIRAFEAVLAREIVMDALDA